MFTKTTVAALSSALLLTGLGLSTAHAGIQHDVTSPLEARRVDNVDVGPLEWGSCPKKISKPVECVKIQVPVDYDEPNGDQLTLGIAKLPARDQKNKLGSLFVNFGGPSAAATDGVGGFANWFMKDVTERFDIIGIDPRGVQMTSRMKCWKTPEKQEEATCRNDSFFYPGPLTKDEQAKAVDAAKRVAQACGRDSSSLAGSVSTAEVARDMEVVRQAIGDGPMNFLGWSYGTYVGQVYANMYPDRVRTIVLDGVVDPLAWRGSEKNAHIPTMVRDETGVYAKEAFYELLKRCDEAGPKKCYFAKYGPARETWAWIMDELDREPITLRDGEGKRVTFNRLTLANDISGNMYSFDVGRAEASLLMATKRALDARAKGDKPRYNALLERLSTLHGKSRAVRAANPDRPEYRNNEWNYDVTYWGVICTDSRNPKRPEDWIKIGEQVDALSDGFGVSWAWESAPCAEKYWTAKDEDAYTGHFRHRLANPMMVFGALYDPATPYAGAVVAHELSPGSILVTSDNWGHTSQYTSKCVDGAMADYIVTAKLPKKNLSCHSKGQPYRD